MENEKKYYLAYLRNPKQTLEDGYDTFKEIEVVVEYSNNEYKEITTRKKVYLNNENITFDGHRVFQSNAQLFGRIIRELSLEETEKKLNNIKKNQDEFTKELSTLSYDTLDKAINDEDRYIKTVKQFVKTFWR